MKIIFTIAILLSSFQICFAQSSTTNSKEVVGPKTSNEDSKSHNPRIPLKETQTTTTTTTNPSTGETTTTTTTTEKYVPFCLNQSSEPCTE